MGGAGIYTSPLITSHQSLLFPAAATVSKYAAIPMMLDMRALTPAIVSVRVQTGLQIEMARVDADCRESR